MAIDAGEILVRFRADTRDGVRQFVVFQAALSKTLATTQDRIGAINRSLNGFGLLAGAGLGLAILKVGRDFDSALTSVQSITKESEEQFKATRLEVLRLASAYGRAADDVGKALYDIVSAGIAGTEATQALTAAIKLGRAGLVDTALSTSVLVGALNSFKLTGADAEDTAGKLIATVDRGVLTFEELASKVGQVTPVAAGAGVEFSELLGILALLTRNGVQFSQAVTQARGVILKLVAPGKEARVELERLLGTTIETSLAQRGFIGTLQQVVTATDGSVAAFRKLFEDTEAIQAVTAIASAGFAELREDIDSIDSAGAERLNQTLEIQARSVKELSDEFGALIKNRVIAFFENNEGAIRDTTAALVDFLRENEAVLDTIIASSAAIAGLSAAGLVLKAGLIGINAVLGIASGLTGALAAAVQGHAVAQAEDAVVTVTNTAAVTANTSARSANTTTTTANAAATVAHSTALALQNRALALNTFAQAQSVATGRIYVQNTAAATAATAASAGAASGLRATLAKLFPTFARFPALLSATAGFAKGAAVALGVLAAKIALIVGVGLAFYKTGQLIGRVLSGNTKEYEEQLKRLRELEKLQPAVARITQQTLIQERNERDTLRESAERYRETLSAMAKAQREAAAGNVAAQYEVIRLRDALAEFGDTGVKATDDATARLRQYSEVVRNALKEAGLLSAAYKGAFTESGRLLAGFGTSTDEITALVKALGEADAQKLIAEIKEAKEEITGLAAAQREYAEAAERAKTVNGLLATATNNAAIATAEYSKTVDGLVQSANGLRGDFVNQFETLRENLIASEQVIRDLRTEFDRLNTTAQALSIQGADPAALQATQEQLSAIESEITRATTAANLFKAALAQLIDTQQGEIFKARFEAIDELTRYEIEQLQAVGKVREAEELAAQSRKEQSLRRIAEAYDEEKRRIEEINALLGNADITGDQRASLEALRDHAEANLQFYGQLETAIDQAYGRELQQIKDNERALLARFEEEQQRRALIALEQEKADQSRIALQGILTGNLDQELEARARIAEIELEILRVKGLNAEQELELIDSLRDRVNLLRDELESLRNIGADTREIIDAIRDAQRDTGGTSDVDGGRERIRDNLEDTQTDEGIQERSEAFRDALDAEITELEKQRQELLVKRQQAIAANDEAAVEQAERDLAAIDKRMKEIGELWRIFTEEAARRLQEVIEETRARETGQTGPFQGINAPTNGDPAKPGQGPAGAPGAPQTPPTPPGPPQQPPTAPQGNPNDPFKAELQRTREELTLATKALVESHSIAREAWQGFGSEVVGAYGDVTRQLGNIAAQLNTNTRELAQQRSEVQRLRIEGR